ncbi:hypothetical protein SeMB42_g06217 [Synchytrium endobioticum]|uniref:Uncharacterized protein n=1 Tax=Synchytrium endobioticum TaxID=286115 RepID=A0A507CJY4_9FUNG|nr:hypothetical protein SeMB42_g06217 [Synchytrium endobioticum]
MIPSMLQLRKNLLLMLVMMLVLARSITARNPNITVDTNRYHPRKANPTVSQFLVNAHTRSSPMGTPSLIIIETPTPEPSPVLFSVEASRETGTLLVYSPFVPAALPPSVTQIGRPRPFPTGDERAAAGSESGFPDSGEPERACTESIGSEADQHAQIISSLTRSTVSSGEARLSAGTVAGVVIGALFAAAGAAVGVSAAYRARIFRRHDSFFYS